MTPTRPSPPCWRATTTGSAPARRPRSASPMSSTPPRATTAATCRRARRQRYPRRVVHQPVRLPQPVRHRRQGQHQGQKQLAPIRALPGLTLDPTPAAWRIVHAAGAVAEAVVSASVRADASRPTRRPTHGSLDASRGRPGAHASGRAYARHRRDCAYAGDDRRTGHVVACCVRRWPHIRRDAVRRPADLRGGIR